MCGASNRIVIFEERGRAQTCGEPAATSAPAFLAGRRCRVWSGATEINAARPVAAERLASGAETSWLKRNSVTLCREETSLSNIAKPRGRLAHRAARIRSTTGLLQSETVKRCGAKLSFATETNEKAVRQQDGLLFQGRIVPTEFEKDHQNFLAKSYWPVKGSVKEFFENRYLCFQ